MAGNVAEMDDLDWLNSRRPRSKWGGTRWTWWPVSAFPDSELAADDIPDDVFDALIGGFLAPTGRFRAYPSEGEAVLALYAAWEAARPGTFPLVKPCTCETCRGELKEASDG